MNCEDFSKKVTLASGILRSLCTSGDPTESQVLEAAQRVNLLIFDPRDSYVVDPVRFAIVVCAYRPRLRAGMTIEVMIERAWKCFEKQQTTLCDSH